MVNRKELFDAIRDIKGAGLTQAEVNRINAILDGTVSTALRVSQRGIDLIHSFESLRLTAYPDPGSRNGLPITCGWGTTVDEDGGPIPRGSVWTKQKADRLFARDLKVFEDGVNELLDGAATTQNQFDALVSIGYNIGLAALRTSTLLRKHKVGDYVGAQRAFASWKFNDGRVLNGLVRRRAAEAALYGEN